jgi:hypothetical protein
MSEPDLNNLRRILDDYESYAKSVASGTPAAMTARTMLGVIAEARAALFPSADSTANFIDTRQLLQRLEDLRAKAESGA